VKIAFLLLLTSTFILAKANPVKPYLAVIHTPTGKTKGVLYYIDSTGLIIDPGNGMVKVKASDIERIKIRKFKKNYQIKKFMKYDPWDDSNFERDRAGNKVRKRNEKDPTLKDEVAGRLGATITNGIINLFVAPFHAINPAVYSTSDFIIKEEVSNLSGYCLFYKYYPECLSCLHLSPNISY
jgi:hypothetical protein